MANPHHTQEVRDAFRAHYLYSGIASEAAEAVGIPDRTGRDWAKALANDPSFAADRRALRAKALDDLVAMRMRVAKTSLKRFEADDAEPLMTKEGAVFPPDRRPEYGKLVIDAEKSAQHLAKIDKDAADGDKPAPVVRVILKDDDGSDD